MRPSGLIGDRRDQDQARICVLGRSLPMRSESLRQECVPLEQVLEDTARAVCDSRASVRPRSARQPFAIASHPQRLAVLGMNPEVDRVNGVVCQAAMGWRRHLNSVGSSSCSSANAVIGIKAELLVTI